MSICSSCISICGSCKSICGMCNETVDVNAKFQQGTPTGKPLRTIKQNYHELEEEIICSPSTV